MSERFWSLSPADRAEALEVAASRLSRPTHILEKDVWVVWLLSVLYDSELGNHLTFKGGTSLSKAYKIIDRFSEDVALLVVQNKKAFFRENDASGATIDYTDAVSGHLQLVPTGAALDLLATDYLEMRTNGMLPESAPDFESLLELCRRCEETLNQMRRRNSQGFDPF